MTVYLSGPMSGLPLLNVPAFAEAAGQLRARGVTVISPPELVPEPRPYWWCILVDLWHLRRAEMLIQLPGWRRSRGARIEACAAILLGLDIEPWPPAGTEAGTEAAPRDFEPPEGPDRLAR